MPGWEDLTGKMTFDRDLELLRAAADLQPEGTASTKALNQEHKRALGVEQSEPGN